MVGPQAGSRWADWLCPYNMLTPAHGPWLLDRCVRQDLGWRVARTAEVWVMVTGKGRTVYVSLPLARISHLSRLWDGRPHRSPQVNYHPVRANGDWTGPETLGSERTRSWSPTHTTAAQSHPHWALWPAALWLGACASSQSPPPCCGKEDGTLVSTGHGARPRLLVVCGLRRESLPLTLLVMV